MASNPNYVKKQIAVDTVSWTAIVAPVDCMGVSIKNSVLVDLRIRTDSGDATTQDTIPRAALRPFLRRGIPAACRTAGRARDFTRGHDRVLAGRERNGAGAADFVR